MENPNSKYDILQVDNIDTFNGIQLGSCLEIEQFKSHQKLLVFEAKSLASSSYDDDYMMDYAVVFFDDGSCWTCMNEYNQWLEKGKSLTTRCTKHSGEYFTENSWSQKT